MPPPCDLRPSASRLRRLADALESGGDDLLAAAARRAAVEIDAAPSSESSRPDALGDGARRFSEAMT